LSYTPLQVIHYLCNLCLRRVCCSFLYLLFIFFTYIGNLSCMCGKLTYLTNHLLHIVRVYVTYVLYMYSTAIFPHVGEM
jgi:hypothetical protein